MSYSGYFEHIIKTWYNIKHTPTAKKDMRTVLHQFDTSIKDGEIPEDKIPYLKGEFQKICKEVYN